MVLAVETTVELKRVFRLLWKVPAAEAKFWLIESVMPIVNGAGCRDEGSAGKSTPFIVDGVVCGVES